jgi:hypothetical protein
MRNTEWGYLERNGTMTKKITKVSGLINWLLSNDVDAESQWPEEDGMVLMSIDVKDNGFVDFVYDYPKEDDGEYEGLTTSKVLERLKAMPLASKVIAGGSLKIKDIWYHKESNTVNVMLDV